MKTIINKWISEHLAQADPMTLSESHPHDVLLLRSYQDLARRQLGRIPGDLFAGFTSLRFQVAWAPVVLVGGNLPPWHTDCSVCCELAADRTCEHPGCLTCGHHHRDSALGCGEGHHFICRLGVSKFCLPIRVSDEIVGIACLQALDGGSGCRPQPDSDDLLYPSALKRPDPHGLGMASRLLQILIQSVETACVAEIRETELADARQSIIALEQEQKHLSEFIHRPLTPPAQLSCHHQPNGHADPLPARILEYLAANYARPITLRSCADRLGMNAAYLSNVFSQTFRVSFKAYLTELRLGKAKELLADPTQCVSAVAYAVGYSSENRFRSVFKQATGLPPRVWRQIMQTTTPADTTGTASSPLPPS